MTAKRDKPALFELVDRGPLKPNTHGAIQTPGWFFGKKVVVTKPTDAEKPAQDKLGNEVKINKPQVGWLDRITRKDQNPTDSGVLPVSNQAKTVPPTRPSGKLFKLEMPYWVLPLIALGLFLTLIATYRLGQNSVADKLLKIEAAEPPGKSLETVRQQPVKEGLLPPTAPPVTTLMPPPVEAAPAVQTSPVPTGPVVVSPKDGNCLVFCGHSNQQELLDVKEFFAANGIVSTVGRMNGRYVLFTTQSFVNTKDSDAVALQNRIAEIGKRYNSEKPKGAARFSSETFGSAFWAKVGNID